jgi:hypothetical protein
MLEADQMPGDGQEVSLKNLERSPIPPSPAAVVEATVAGGAVAEIQDLSPAEAFRQSRRLRAVERLVRERAVLLGQLRVQKRAEKVLATDFRPTPQDSRVQPSIAVSGKHPESDQANPGLIPGT